MTNHLLLADHRAGWWRAIPVPDLGRTLPPAHSATLAEHAGVLRLPAGAPARAVLADDAQGTLVALHANGTVAGIPAAIPAEHLACDASGRFVACSTGLGASWEPWSDLVTVADLVRGTAFRFRLSRAGEPGIAISGGADGAEPVLLLRHREPGAVEAIPLAQAQLAGPHCPRVEGTVLSLTGHHGHGDAFDRTSGVLHCATETGIERILVDGSQLRRLDTWPWPVGGRAYFLRLDPVGRTLVAALRGGPADPARWHEWHNHVAVWSLEEGSVEVAPTGDGLVFRPDTLAGDVAWTVVHPDGDQLCRRGSDGTVVATPLPAMSAAPRPGATPWDPVDGRPAQRRAVALLDPHRTAVTRGGHGELHVVDRGTLVTTVDVGTPLDEGGHLCLLPTVPDALVDGIGR